ncbi:hypothetical protein C8F04DRAFT_1240924 [Mycena alexandri]|uniref:Uncharacterized protein n=1 Tax=Mycena alexandri TaxID=1745969 RepID=A0AAD6S845_9AGAR|nr:hypothetical protein C8F04DRAFT_1240924 [Mycena alexandri]
MERRFRNQTSVSNSADGPCVISDGAIDTWMFVDPHLPSSYRHLPPLILQHLRLGHEAPNSSHEAPGRRETQQLESAFSTSNLKRWVTDRSCQPHASGRLQAWGIHLKSRPASFSDLQARSTPSTTTTAVQIDIRWYTAASFLRNAPPGQHSRTSSSSIVISPHRSASEAMSSCCLIFNRIKSQWGAVSTWVEARTAGRREPAQPQCPLTDRLMPRSTSMCYSTWTQLFYPNFNLINILNLRAYVGLTRKLELGHLGDGFKLEFTVIFRLELTVINVDSGRGHNNVQLSLVFKCRHSISCPRIEFLPTALGSKDLYTFDKFYLVAFLFPRLFFAFQIQVQFNTGRTCIVMSNYCIFSDSAPPRNFKLKFVLKPVPQRASKIPVCEIQQRCFQTAKPNVNSIWFP